MQFAVSFYSMLPTKLLTTPSTLSDAATYKQGALGEADQVTGQSVETASVGTHEAMIFTVFTCELSKG